MLARRLLSFPLLVLTCLVAWAASPALLVAALFVDVFRGRLLTTRFLAFVLVLVTCELAGLVAGISIGTEPRVNYALQRAWAGQLWGWACRLYGMKLEVSGDPLPRGAFVSFWRHASYADTVLPIMTMASPSRFPRYVLKRELLWDPCLDLVGNRLQNLFVQREGGTDAQLAELASLATTASSQDFVVLYPEGTRFTPARQAHARERVPAEWKEAALALSHTLPPRPAGALALLDAGHDVVFAAHTGLEGAAKLGGLLSGRVLGSTVRVHLRVVRAADIPKGREERIAWLYAEWARVNAIVAEQLGAAPPANGIQGFSLNA